MDEIQTVQHLIQALNTMNEELKLIKKELRAINGSSEQVIHLTVEPATSQRLDELNQQILQKSRQVFGQGGRKMTESQIHMKLICDIDERIKNPDLLDPTKEYRAEASSALLENNGMKITIQLVESNGL